MLFTIALILFVLWLLGFVAFHVTTAFIHALIVVAVVLFILGLFRTGPRRTVV